MNKAVLAAAVVLTSVMVGIPAQSQAERWYRSPWFWGGTGLVVGGVVGHEIGRHNERNRHRDVYYAQPAYAPGSYYSYDGGPYVTGQSYVRTTRVWPFYKKTVVYPVASMVAPVMSPTAVSMADPRYAPSDFASSNTAPDSGEVSISIGDNNQDVSISVGGRSMEPQTTVRTVEKANYRESHPLAAKNRNRTVDVQVVEPVAVENEATTETEVTPEAETETTATE